MEEKFLDKSGLSYFWNKVKAKIGVNSEAIGQIQGLIPSSASTSNQLADKAYVSAATSGSPYIYMTQAEYEALTEYEPDRLYYVIYPLSKCHLIWCNGECVDGVGAENLAGYYLYSSSNMNKVVCNYKYLAITYNPIGFSSSSPSMCAYPNLIKIDIAKGVTEIGESAFYGSKYLKNISIPESVKSIKTFALRECISLIEISIPEGVTSIGTNGIAGCTSLTKISLPSTITQIAGNAFSGCTHSDLTITINQPQDNISGSPWSATKATIVWTG